MQIKKKTNIKKIIAAVVVIAIIIGSGVTTAILINNYHKEPSTSSDSNKRTNNKKTDSHSGNKDESNKNDNKSNNNSGDKDNTPDQPESEKHTQPQYDGQGTANDPVKSSTLSGNINGFSIVNNSSLMIRVTIAQLIDSGTCELTLTGPNGQTYTDQAKVMADPQSSTCYGWDIPVDKLGNYHGHWKASIKIDGGGKTGTITREADL